MFSFPNPVLTPSVSILDPGNLFATTSPTLVCSVSVDSSVVDVPVTASVEWDGPRGIGFFSVSGPLSGGSTTLSVPLTNTVTGDSGDYICRASVSTTTAYPQVSPSSEGSDSRSITVCELLSIACEIVLTLVISLSPRWCPLCPQCDCDW